MGIFLLAFGRKMLNWAIILLLFIVTSCGSFLVLYNLGAVPGLDQGKTTVMIVVACICGVLGAIATFFFNRILNKEDENTNPEERRAKFLSTCMGGLLVGVLLAATPFPAFAKVACILL